MNFHVFLTDDQNTKVLSHEGCTPSNVLFNTQTSDYEDNDLLPSSELELELNSSECIDAGNKLNIILINYV